MLSSLAARLGTESELLDAARLAARRRDNILGLLLRPLTREEIAVMEDRGCRADDWATVQVAQDFDAFRVRRTHLRGRCTLGRFAGEVEVAPGVRLGAGIYDCTLIDCQIGNDCLIENVRFAANLVVERDAVLFDIGAITCSGAARFACGQALTLGPESGGREVPLWAELTVDDAALVARERGDRDGQAAVCAAVARYAEAVTSPVAWVRRGARVRHTTRLSDCYIGAGAVVDNALGLDDCCLLSSVEEPVTVGTGALAAHSVLQWGVRLGGGAIVRHAALLEHSSADAHATIEQAVIGPNTHVEKGEITASLVGPFVGFHHQSMLIAVIWPEGKGNVAHGAMIGSNHTGRAPDQECWPGEGTFHGLGCAVRFPSDFSQAPYTTIGMGTTTLPQRCAFPFSLIAVPTEPLDDARIPRAYNEIIPAWSLYANAYGLVRTELKLKSRNRARRQRIDHKVLRPSTMRLVRDARDALKAVTRPQPFYLETDIAGLGKNVLREAVRQKAIAVYERTLLRYGLRIQMNEREGRLEIPGSAEIGRELCDELAGVSDFAARMRLLCSIERENAELVQASKARDDERGTRIIPGYADAHLAAADDPVVQSAWERVARTEARVRALGIALP